MGSEILGQLIDLAEKMPCTKTEGCNHCQIMNLLKQQKRKRAALIEQFRNSVKEGRKE